ncbi:alpha-D-ribose 1-methylphosphonate 5-triphosphate diphosphatase [Pseudosulfitobacter pseudonitzschiae]|uniref:alpha-D-ribose 1-methylphosphonate 5-triphosphate diphosphatase n=1 Tax=Pseudosulfitobacter pseudonitzschiae TaxID=1402135 RepID=UPI001AFC6C76|nr:alpha-D-ribose 1-methylphosphonate 5-triphosphate diphosphatase [Pseudosulfitobacter pseudonitzschiae]MBM1814116.1 alpha-D-ribose 1-methylphosphonate 5-triphosphate diphosphatase [Pseudosulfitobacter pseudonitzschiae]MBM1831109.1 alpha-D-ribose 1-methylphosphonate 5-triphosphate diphosphatase [Pseudosulfitobacter pseudonitzschiae]MBM1835976.1 alpha-D-ribose 1-methylphosphonate 5-triphosphate diphosphatase [Pseudosulfitobacter pseudonitzschiae]MBM1840822.1 alpha-D-ribose 1-methylphosphonate 5
MLTIDITGAEVLGPQGFHRDGLSLGDGVIADAPVGRSVDLSGFRVLPGIVDVHGDGFERHLAPRRGAMKQMAEGLIAAEAELAANGITTGVLAQFVSWEGGLRGMEFADQVFTAIRDTAGGLVTDLRPQLRFETHLLDNYAGLPARIAEWGVSYVVFNDHLPHARLAEGRKPPRLVGQALKAQRNPEVHFQMLLDLHARRAEVPVALDTLCAELDRMGVQMGSHDDHTAEARAAWRARGVKVSEFPETLDAAEAASGAGDVVILGAPNLVRGGSHKGNVSALDVVSMGMADAVASDYHYPSPRRAALMLARSGVMDFAAAWSLVSAGPARALGLDDRGVLQAGKRADLVVLDSADRVAMTVSGGRVSYLSGDIAARLVA